MSILKRLFGSEVKPAVREALEEQIPIGQRRVQQLERDRSAFGEDWRKLRSDSVGQWAQMERVPYPHKEDLINDVDLTVSRLSDLRRLSDAEIGNLAVKRFVTKPSNAAWPQTVLVYVTEYPNSVFMFSHDEGGFDMPDEEHRAALRRRR